MDIDSLMYNNIQISSNHNVIWVAYDVAINLLYGLHFIYQRNHFLTKYFDSSMY